MKVKLYLIHFTKNYVLFIVNEFMIDNVLAWP